MTYIFIYGLLNLYHSVFNVNISKGNLIPVDVLWLDDGCGCD